MNGANLNLGRFVRTFMLATVAKEFLPGEAVGDPGVYTCDAPCRHIWIAHTRAADIITRQGTRLAPAASPEHDAGCKGTGWMRRVRRPRGSAERRPRRGTVAGGAHGGG